MTIWLWKVQSLFWKWKGKLVDYRKKYHRKNNVCKAKKLIMFFIAVAPYHMMLLLTNDPFLTIELFSTCVMAFSLINWVTSSLLVCRVKELGEIFKYWKIENKLSNMRKIFFQCLRFSSRSLKSFFSHFPLLSLFFTKLILGQILFFCEIVFSMIHAVEGVQMELNFPYCRVKLKTWKVMNQDVRFIIFN